MSTLVKLATGGRTGILQAREKCEQMLATKLAPVSDKDAVIASLSTSFDLPERCHSNRTHLEEYFEPRVFEDEYRLQTVWIFHPARMALQKLEVTPRELIKVLL